MKLNYRENLKSGQHICILCQPRSEIIEVLNATHDLGTKFEYSFLVLGFSITYVCHLKQQTVTEDYIFYRCVIGQVCRADSVTC